jgi:hypothetical protein
MVMIFSEGNTLWQELWFCRVDYFNRFLSPFLFFWSLKIQLSDTKPGTDKQWKISLIESIIQKSHFRTKKGWFQMNYWALFFFAFFSWHKWLFPATYFCVSFCLDRVRCLCAYFPFLLLFHPPNLFSWLWFRFKN